MTTLDIRPQIAGALAANRAVVALESTVIAHGLPWPENLETAKAMEAAIVAAGAVPATIGIIGGTITIGLEAEELERFARTQGIVKVSRRDFGSVIAAGRDGATTVAATMICAAQAGIRVFATGGIGGVHRGAKESFDVSADLRELGRTPVLVVCSGAKSILDLPHTLEVLETEGVPVVGYGTDRLPAFHARDSGLDLDQRVDTPAAAAALAGAHWDLGLGGLVVANPVPAGAAIASEVLERWIDDATKAATAQSVAGKDVTPFLLDRLAALSEGKTLAANKALLIDNARVAAEIAGALATS